MKTKCKLIERKFQCDCGLRSSIGIDHPRENSKIVGGKAAIRCRPKPFLVSMNTMQAIGGRRAVLPVQSGSRSLLSRRQLSKHIIQCGKQHNQDIHTSNRSFNIIQQNARTLLGVLAAASMVGHSVQFVFVILSPPAPRHPSIAIFNTVYI